MNDLKLKLTQKEKDPQSYSYFKKKFNDYENRIMVLEKTMKENCLEQKL